MRLTKENILTALDYLIEDYKKRQGNLKNIKTELIVKGKIEALEDFKEDINDQFYFYSTDIFKAAKDI